MLRGVNIGRFDVKITIQKPTYSTSSVGESTRTYTTYKTTYAQRKRTNGGESNLNNQTVGTAPTEYIIRHDSGIGFDYRLYEGSDSSNVFHVKNVQHWKREGYTQITAERRDNGT